MDSSPQPPNSSDAADFLSDLARRDELRAEAHAALSGVLDGRDFWVLALIGLLGALPATFHLTLPEPFAKVLTGAGLANAPNAAAIGGAVAAGTVQFDLNHLTTILTSDTTGAGWFAGQLAQDGSAVAAVAAFQTLVPDLEDIATSAVTAKLSDLWCSHRGWKAGEQAYHEAKALAYAVKAVVGAPFNPDPVAFALASYHGAKAFMASARSTDRLVELSTLAVANGERIVDNYRTELAASELVDQATKAIISGPASWSAEDRERSNEALLAAISPTPSRRKA